MVELPQQVDGLDLNPVDDGLIVNDDGRGKVHFLNRTAGLVLALCSGKNSIHDITVLLQKQFDLAELPKDDITEILESFVKEKLIKFEK